MKSLPNIQRFSFLTKNLNALHVLQTFLYIWIKEKIPLFKSRGPKAFNNYRPIAISLILSKIIKRIVYRRTM